MSSMSLDFVKLQLSCPWRHDNMSGCLHLRQACQRMPTAYPRKLCDCDEVWQKRTWRHNMICERLYIPSSRQVLLASPPGSTDIETSAGLKWKSKPPTQCSAWSHPQCWRDCRCQSLATKMPMAIEKGAESLSLPWCAKSGHWRQPGQPAVAS